MPTIPRRARRGLGLVAALGAGLALGAGPAAAGTCPADQMRPDATRPVAHAAKGVTDTVLASIDVAKEPAAINGRLFRLRKLTIEPGGIVPLHSHGDRPAIIYIVQGEVIEYASNCAVPIVHKAGDVSTERHVTSHWWENKGSETVVLLSADLLRDARDKNM